MFKSVESRVAVVTSVWHLGALLYILSWFVTPLQASVSTIVQTETPPEMLGRTGSALNEAFTASNVAAMAIAGGAAAIVEVRTVFLAAGVIIALSGLVTAVMFRGASSSTSMAATEPQPELT